MTPTSVRRSRALSARLVPLVVALGALPLMAPTCGTSDPGFRTFSRRSLVIPMDVCYQYMADGVRASYTPAGGATACPAVDPGDVIRAYGLVYQLIRNGVPVYWVIDNAKSAVDGVDLTIQYQGGFPVFLYDWATGAEGAAPTLGGDRHTINYRGGPFVVDGSDYARASAILQSFRSTFGAVNVHVSNVAFRGWVMRTMAGAWSAGGATPPKLALLDIGSSGAGAKNSEVVIQGYLTRAGLDTPGAAGTATGNHGEIFDRLFMPDFVPTAGDWTTTRLARNGYRILWVPHWAAPSSCSDCPPSTSCTCQVKYSPATITAALETIGSFVNQVNPVTGARGDLFAECAGLGSFEGVFGAADPSATGVNAVYGTGVASTHFETEGVPGVWINKNVGSALYRGQYANPLMQIGDYPFIPRTGAIQNFKANQYKAEVVPLISEASSPTYDIFNFVPGTSSHGTVVYLGGHSYSGTDGAFEVAGTRLVLNTLFNLGSTCTAGDAPCTTGLPGVCSAGRYACQGDQAVCTPTVQPGGRAEECNGLDDDCDGQVDEDLQKECYDGPAATKTLGVCRPGITVCQRNPDGTYGMSACQGQVLPTSEACNGLDDDCDGAADDGVPAIACYDGPPLTVNVGECRPGTQVCQDGQYGAPAGAGFVPGACSGQVLPRPEICSDAGAPGGAKDDDCDGVVNNGCACTPGRRQVCFSGPGTPGLGTCRSGEQVCDQFGNWGRCEGETVASLEPEACTSVADVPSGDTNCDGHTLACPECAAGASRRCYGPDPANPPAYAGVGQCAYGSQSCGANGKWGGCTGYVLPSKDLEGIPIEYCDGKDNDCNGQTDENAVCPAGNTCVRGVCVPSVCGNERPPPEGYACTFDPAGAGSVVSSSCGASASPGCAVGAVCQFGNCVDPCPVDTTGASKVCGQGTVCGGGACIGGSCYEAGCPSGEICVKGSCTADPCAGRFCPSGTFCRQGDCVQACTFVTCFTDEKCGVDGFCEPDPCAGKACGAGQKCTGGVCAADPCLGKGCATGQICVVGGATGKDPVCEDDPCTGVVCPAGTCAGGQCFPSGNPTGAGTASRTPASSSSGGCGCGSGTGAALPALLVLLAAPLARRRRRARGGRGALLVVLLAAALVASACKESSTDGQFDPTGCVATCGEQRCVSLATDPAHCGRCDRACAAGEQCVDGSCGPSALVAPYLRSLGPSSGPKDARSFAVTVSGDRLKENAQLRVSAPSGPQTLACPGASAGDCPSAPCCRWASAASLSVRLDLRSAPAGQPWSLRVVNPDGVISNPASFGVVIPTPAIGGVVPSSVAAGASTLLAVSGSGFTSGSRCRLFPVPSIESYYLPSSLVDATRLDCSLDATALPPSSYSLEVVSELPPGSTTPLRSNPVTVTVAPSDPVVYAIDPSSGTTAANFAITGARFDPTSQVLFVAPGQTTQTVLPSSNVTVLNGGQIFVHDYVPATPGTWSVLVRTGTRVSNAVAFAFGVTPATINAFAPATAYQGDPVTLTFTGAAFPNPARIELLAPGSTTYERLQATAVSCSGTCSASASKDFAGQPDGQWLARLRLGTTDADPASAPWPLRVLSNQAILRDYAATPSPAQGGAVATTKSAFRFAVSNIRGPDFSQVKVLLLDPAGVVTAVLDPSPDPSLSTTELVVPGPTPPWTAALDLAGFDAGVYTFKVQNPNATPSNALPFAVTPGAPTLASLCAPQGASCVSSVRQSDTPVTVQLTGTNFARPDANGNGSTVVFTADFMPGWPAADPCSGGTSGTQFQPVPGTVTVVSSTRIDVQLDTRAAYVDPVAGTAYYVGVWNPGGASGGLQKSSCDKDPRTLPSFKILP